MKVTVLGCGGSGGVPLLGNDWGACDPENPKNRRSRVSILVEEGAAKILMDTSPDLREQLLKAQISYLTAILYTHDHADHTQGIDDLRFLAYRSEKEHKRILPAFGTADTLKILTNRFGYIFSQLKGGSAELYKPFLEAREIIPGHAFMVDGISILPFQQHHGFGTYSTGYRIANMAYSTDVVSLPTESKECLRGLDLWIVDCLRWEPHLTHAHFDQVLDWVEELKPRRTILTHLNQSMDYEAVRKRCPEGIEPGFDGMVIG